MKAISLHQPWASLVVAGVKRFETRSWPAPQTIIGQRIYIHAAKTRKGMKASPNSNSTTIRQEEKFWIECLGCLDCADLPFGAIIGAVTVVESLGTTHMPETLKDVFGDYSPGRYAWRLYRPHVFKNPWPCKGRQGIFNVDPNAKP